MKRKFQIILVLILSIGMIMPGFALAADDTITLRISTVDPNNQKVESVSFSVYKQETDFNDNKVTTTKAVSSNTSTSGYKEVSFRASANFQYAIKYARGSHEARVFEIWDHDFDQGKTYDVKLTLSTANIVLKDGHGELLKNYNFDIYTAVSDYSGNEVPASRVFYNRTTGSDGHELFYLKPGEYILKYKYPGISKLKANERLFTITADNQTEVIETVGVINFAIRDSNGDLDTNENFRLYKETEIFNSNDFEYLASFSTGSLGYKKIYLSDGDYRITYKDSDGQYTQEEEFNITNGSSRDIVNTNESFQLRILDTKNSPIKNRRVEIYKDYRTNDVKVYAGNTDSRGYVKTSALNSGNFYAVTDSPYKNVKYQSPLFYYNDGSNDEDDDFDFEFQRYDFVLSRARITLKDESDKLLKQEVFTIYKYAVDANGKTKAGSEITTQITNSSAYAEIDLPDGKYLIKIKSKDGLYPIAVKASQLNKITVDLAMFSIAADTEDTATTTDITLLASDSLYDQDSDNDGIADFAERNIYNTNPYSRDTDGDGFLDKMEIDNNYNPNGPGQKYYINFSYDKPRVNSLALEQDLAQRLKVELIRRMSRLDVSAENWHTLVNSYVYGEYSITEIVNTLNYGPGQVHPTIPASIWRNR